MNSPLLLLCSGSALEGGERLGEGVEGVDVLVTHEIVPVPEGIEEALAFDPAGATLIVTSRTTVILLDEASAGFFRRNFGRCLASGEATSLALLAAGAPAVVVPEVPGAAGVVDLLSELGAGRLLWPHGSDADTAPLEAVRASRTSLTAPVVYEKCPVRNLDPVRLEAFFAGHYAGVAVSSTAALDVFLAAARANGRAFPNVRWGAIGPATARALTERHLPAPVVPTRARLTDLIDALKRAASATET